MVRGSVAIIILIVIAFISCPVDTHHLDIKCGELSPSGDRGSSNATSILTIPNYYTNVFRFLSVSPSGRFPLT